MKVSSYKKITLPAMFLALGLLLPLITGQIPQIGNMLLPMHLPVMLCGLLCGWKIGVVIGFVTPLLRYLIFGMPMLYPVAIAMAFELAAYGLVIGVCYIIWKRRGTLGVYLSLIIAMIIGRVVWATLMWLLMGASGGTFTGTMFLAGAVTNAIPGIILQLLIIPALMHVILRMEDRRNA